MWMEKTDCFGLEWVPSVDGAPSIEAKNQIASSKTFLAVKTCQVNVFFWLFYISFTRPGEGALWSNQLCDVHAGRERLRQWGRGWLCEGAPG